MILSNFFKKVIYVCSALICIILTIYNIAYINNIDNTEFSNIEPYRIKYLLISLGIIFLIMAISYLINKIKILRKYKTILIVSLFIIYGIMQIIWVIKSIAIPFADSEQVLIISRGFLGKEHMINYCCRYLEYYPQQITLSVVFSLTYIITNNTNYSIIQYINVIFNIMSMVGMYFIICVLSKKYNINKVLFFILILTFIPIILLSTFVYGDFIGLACAIWATYFAMKVAEKNNNKYIIVSAILIAISCLVRMNYIIFAIALVIYWMIDILERNNRNIKKTLFDVIFIVLFLLIIFIPSKIIKTVINQKYNLNSEKSFSTVPYLLMGMSEGDRGFGWYNNEMGDRVYHLMCDEEELARQKAEDCEKDLEKRIDYFIEHPIYCFKFYTKKLITMWSEPTYEYAFYNGVYKEGINIDEHPLIKSINQGKLKEIIKIYQKGIILLIFFGVAYVTIFKFKNADKDLTLLMTIFFGGFMFHLLWEAKSRYILPYMVILIPVASIGITDILKKIEKIFKKKEIKCLK